MTIPLPIAQTGISFLFYLLVGIIWLVGNLMQQKAAKRKAEELRKRREEREREEQRTGKKSPPERKSERGIEDELETFLGRLAGEDPASRQPQRREPPPPPPPKATPPPLKPRVRFDPPSPPKASTKPVKEKEITVGAEMKKKSKIREMDLQDSFKEMPELKEMEEAVSDLMDKEVRHDALENVRSLMVDLSSSNMNMPTLKMQSMRPVDTRTSRPDLTRKGNVKRALVNSVILGPPKALQEQPFKERP